MRELKLDDTPTWRVPIHCRTLPRVRELKRLPCSIDGKLASRTLPRVREVKRRTQPHIDNEVRRTLPRVRELKQ